MKKSKTVYTFASSVIALATFGRQTVFAFKKGSLTLKLAIVLTYLWAGLGHLMTKQVVKGLIMMSFQIFYIVFMLIFGITAIRGFIYLDTPGIESQYNLVYGLIAFFVTGFMFGIYMYGIRHTLKNVLSILKLEQPMTFKAELKSLIHERFYIVLLFLPVTGALLFTVIPLMFMILIAFTNYGHGPNNVIPIMNERYLSWTGFQSFTSLFTAGGNLNTFMGVLSWTMIWATLATITCYIGGLFLAMLLNKKIVRLKMFWRTVFIIVMATPQFASLRIMYAMFDRSGFINSFLLNAGIITERISFWDNVMTARILIVVINMWIGIPFFMLLMSGLLINIPVEYYEFARIEGASKFYIFRRITMPYILFLTAPVIITSFVANINNFNVIYLLTGGGPMGGNISGVAGQTDILITWLFKLTMRYNPIYNLGAAIGIIMFIISIVLSINIYRRTKSYKDERGFA